MIGSRTHGVQEDQVVQPEAAGIGPVRDTHREFLQLFASIAHREPCDMPACHCTEQVLLYCCTHCGVTLCFPTPSTQRLGIWDPEGPIGTGVFFCANAKPLRYLGTYHRPNPIPLSRTSCFCYK